MEIFGLIWILHCGIHWILARIYLYKYKKALKAYNQQHPDNSIDLSGIYDLNPIAFSGQKNPILPIIVIEVTEATQKYGKAYNKIVKYFWIINLLLIVSLIIIAIIYKP